MIKHFFPIQINPLLDNQEKIATKQSIFVHHEYEQLRKTIKSATLLLSNFYLAHKQGYFDLSANENPILHIWSLAVEEQYYLFFPLLLVVAYKKFKTHQVFKPIVLGLTLLFILTSFIPQSIYIKIGWSNTYYISFIRFPELLIGSYLALSKPRVKPANHFVGFGIFIALILTLFFYHKSMPLMPGIVLLLPCILTALLIHFSSQNSWGGVKTLLSLKPIVWVGKLSYSLYLFHWIFIAFTYYISGEKELPQGAILPIIVLTFICSALSYYLLEQPIRKSKLTFKQSFFLLYLIPSLVVIGYNLSVRSHIKHKTSALQAQKAEQEVLPLNIPSKILTIGDSHAGHLEDFLNYVGAKEGWRSDILRTSDCLSFEDKDCAKYWQKIESYPVIFISMFYELKRGGTPVPRFNPNSFVIADFDQKFQAMVKHLAKTKKVYVFANNISLNRSALRNAFLAKYDLDKYLNPIQKLADNTASNNEIFQLIKDIPNVTWVDAAKYLGDTVYVGNKSIYGDQDHFTPFGSYYMGTLFHEKERLLSPQFVSELYQ
uniref:Possible acetyltransferase n=1 Tax=Histophilus somni (strain 129Pt) TaxID=205914 RepID=Q0I1Z9_HISS1